MASTISIYAPLSAGLSGQVLYSNGNGKAPTWDDSLKFDDIYPVGSIYLNIGATLPIALSANGRTWEKIQDGRFLMNSNTDYAPGSVGGSNNKVLTLANLPNHAHSFSGTTSSNGSHTHTRKGWWGFTYDTSSSKQGASKDYVSGDDPTYGTEAAGAHTHTFSGNTAAAGGNTAFDNRPAFLAVSMWKRTS